MKTKAGYLSMTAVIALFLGSAPRADAQDVMKAGVGVYSMLGDSLNARAMMASFAPGATVSMHSHPVHMIYVIDGGTLTITVEGKEPTAVEFKPGMFAISPPETHMATNTGTTTLRAIVIELTDPMAGHKH